MDIFKLNGKAYVQLSFLKKYGVNEQTIANGMSRNRKELSIYFDHISDPIDKRIRWIRYASITPQIKSNHKLPTEDQVMKIAEQLQADKIENFISLNLHLAFEEGYKPYLKHYMGLYFDPELIRSYARTHAVFHQIQQMRGVDIPINKIFRIFCKLEGLQFETDSLKVFYAKLKKYERYGHEAFIHHSLGKTKNSRKISESLMKQLKTLYMDRSQYSYREIHEKLSQWAILNGYSEISLSTVKKILSDPYIQNQCKPYRNGKEWERYNLNPFRLREQPKFNGELWQLDGSRLQFPYLGDNNCAAFLQLFVVMDVHSRKIVGYSTGKTENHTLAIEAIRKAVETTGYLPFEMLTDNGSCFKHERFKRLEQYISILGTNFRRCKPDSPREKAQVERFFSTFQTVICKGKQGYVGEGVKSKREEGRPSKAVLKEALNPRNLRSKKDLELLVDELIMEYNSKKINDKNHAPETQFTIGKLDESVSMVSENDFALMFWDRVQEYQIRNSMVLLSEGNSRNQQFQYIINELESRYRLNGTKVLVTYQKSERSKIKLFNENEQFIMDLGRTHKIESVRPPKKSQTTISRVNQVDVKVNYSKNKPLTQPIPSKNQLYKAPATFDALLIKTKGNDE